MIYTDAHVREMVKASMEKFGWSLRQFAQEVELSPTWVSKFIRGSEKCGPKLLTYYGLRKREGYEADNGQASLR
jgi:transcriptional regulator with XRE-family HTH domain